MSHLQYFSYEGFGQQALKNTYYNQAARAGPIIELSGQGGWDRATGKVHADKAQEVDQVFENIEVALKDAGGKGWDEVYKVRAYVVGWDDELAQHMVRNLRKYCPNHAPALTGIGVARLAIDGMRVEIEVTAHVKE